VVVLVALPVVLVAVPVVLLKVLMVVLVFNFLQLTEMILNHQQ
tara:strand:+ start:359 stop:487 length:129 start_codon:yes stop_codon:yes gene_type:complete